MPSMIIDCKDSKEKTQEIEESGALAVISCIPLDNQDDVPEEDQQCEITWE